MYLYLSTFFGLGGLLNLEDCVVFITFVFYVPEALLIFSFVVQIDFYVDFGFTVGGLVPAGVLCSLLRQSFFSFRDIHTRPSW